MKKTLLFVAALVISAMSFADSNTCTWNNANAEAADVAKGSYGNLKDKEATITLDGVIYLAQDILRPNNNTPTGYAGDQVLQFKKVTGHFINKTAMTLVSIEMIVNDETLFEVATGTASDALTPATLSGTDEVIQLITYKDKKPGDPADVTYRKVIVDLSGKKFVKVSGLNGGKGAPTPFLYKAVLKYEGAGGEATHVESVNLDATEKKMVAYETFQLTATVLPDDADDKSLTWSSSDEKVATVSNAGLVTAVAAGEATITAASVDGNKTATCKVTVEAAKKSDFFPVAVSAIATGDEIIITMTVDSVGIPMVMDNAKVTSKGANAIAGGLVEGSIVPATDGVVFIATVDGDSITFAPKGGEEGAILYCTDDNAGIRITKPAANAQGGFKWAVDPEFGYLNSTFVKKREGKSDTTITRYIGEYQGVFHPYSRTAKMIEDGKMATNIKDQTLRLFKKGATPVAVTGVKLDKAEAELEIGKTLQLVATVEPADAANKDVTWATSDAKIATVSDKGLVTAVAEGEATITVKTVDGGKKASATITVIQPVVKVTGVSLDKTEATLKVGEKLQLTATISPSDATNKAVTWASKDAAIASVDDKGLVQAVAEGETTITVKTVDGKKTATAKIKVEASMIAVESVALDITEQELKVGEELQLTATVKPDDATNKAVKWASSDAKIATVDDKGLVKAVAKGEATITVTTEDGAKTASAKITVVEEEQGIEQIVANPELSGKVLHQGTLYIIRDGKMYNVTGERVK